MEALRRKLSDLSDGKILTYGCAGNLLNLVERAVTPNSVIKHVVEVQKFFRNHHRAHGLLRKKNGKKPQLPNDTRWNSQLDCLFSFNENFSKYREIAREDIEETAVPREIRNKLNGAIYQNSLDMYEQLKVVGNSLDKVRDLKNISIKIRLLIYD